MASRDVAKCSNHQSDRQTMRQRDNNEIAAARQRLGRDDGADADGAERKRAEKLSRGRDPKIPVFHASLPHSESPAAGYPAIDAPNQTAPAIVRVGAWGRNGPTRALRGSLRWRRL